MAHRLFPFLLCLATFASAQQNIPWPATRVQFQQHAANNPSYQNLPVGISLWQAPDPADYVFDEFMMRWTSPDDDGPGMTGLLDDVLTDTPLDILHFGRTGADIQLRVRFHAPRNPKPVPQKILFAAPFPRDLPPGQYTITVELKDDNNTTQQRHTRKLLHRPAQPSPLAKLSDEELLAEYVRLSEEVESTGIYSLGAAMFQYRNPRVLAWQHVKLQLVQRRQTIIPALLKLLEAESVKNQRATDRDFRFSAARDLIEILAYMQDPRPVPTLIHILQGMEGRANIPVRRRALEALPLLTHIYFVIDRDASAPYGAVVSHDSINLSRRDLDDPENLSRVATLYGRWYLNEGKDPDTWIAIARAQARADLRTDDAYFVQPAALFLVWHQTIQPDDAPGESLKALDYALSRTDRTLVQNPDIADYFGYYGPLAREYLPRMIAAARRNPTYSRINGVAKVGGQPAVDLLVELLPTLRQGVEKLGLPLEVGIEYSHEHNAANALTAYHASRLGIERGTGQTFDTDDQLLAWYADNKSKSQQQWLEDSLDKLISQADAGNRRARYLARQIVPDLPANSDDDQFRPDWYFANDVPYYESQTPTPNHPRQTWLEENRQQLQFDPSKSQFVLKK